MREMWDRASIRNLLATYFMALDRRDHAAVLSVFAHDANLSMHGEHVASGVEEIAKFFSTGAGTGRLGIERKSIVSMYHTMGTHYVDWRNETASAETYAVAYVCHRAEGGEFVAVRGIRYLDELRRTSSE
ncbi:nuclear transport factor 2 family protein [Rhodococcus sp. T2V]|uniref:nuclear transport factor 2 family protein n=1 Tax=Rhodococcus sp. T2V TaxID=3034164 RepID=UPI0023E33A92|nr:nuclear transport factor 2 family protein [Rhodococcus sp. T2V]